MAALVSIALCTYNGQKFLAPQLHSILAQDGIATEIIAVDDGSTDGTVDLLEQHARHHPAFRVIRHARNAGHANRLAEAFSLCTGAWIAPCDQDDVWAASKLRRLVDAATAAGADAAYADSMICDEAGSPSGRRLGQAFAMQEGRGPMRLALQNCVSGHAMVFHRSLLARASPFPPEFYFDHWLALSAMAGNGLVHVPEVLVHFRRHASAQSDIGVARGGVAGGPWFESTASRLAVLAERFPPGRPRHASSTAQSDRIVPEEARCRPAPRFGVNAGRCRGSTTRTP